MKKVLLALFLFAVLTLSASQYWVVGEVFSALGWGYCASARAGLSDLEEYPDAPFFIPIIWQGNGSYPSPHYSVRGSMYGVGGIPHSQWGGVVDIVGGAGSTMFSQYRSRYNAMVGWESPLEINLLLDPGYETLTADITVTGEITSTNNKVIVLLANHQTDDYFCSAVTYDEYDFDLTTVGEMVTYEHQINAAGYDINNLSLIVLVQTFSGDHRILQAGRVIVSEATVPLQVENIDFDPVMVGETATQTIELFNYSDDVLIGMMFPPPGFNIPADFSIPAHTIGEVEIEFAPQQATMYDDILIVTTSQVDYPTFFVNVSGEGIPSNHQDDNEVSEAIILHGNYPNPFNPETTISYEVANSGNVTLAVFNLKGELVAELVNEIQSAGSYQVVWQAENNSSGMYLMRLISDDQIAEQKMILLK